MALVQRAILKSKLVFFLRSVVKNYSTEYSIKKSVLISQSKDIYTNLALQEWIYKNLNLSEQHVLMLWQNDPCVTIGQNQNPWLEANVDNLPNINECGVKLARQKSYGDAMYHDLGNLNMTFFTLKERFNEEYNMELISRALFREYSLKIDLNQGNFTMRGNYNVSATTKKLGTINAYHHCSLLARVNKIDFTQSLRKREIGMQCENGRKRTERKVMNLCEENSNVRIENLMKAVGWEYMRTPAFTIRDGGNHLANQQNGFQMINPTESWFPGIAKIRDDLTKWDWLFGQTPDFKVTRTFSVLENLSKHPDDFSGDLNILMTVSRGIIIDTLLFISPNTTMSGIKEEVKVFTEGLIGQKFSSNILNNLQDFIKQLVDDKEKFVSDCLRQGVISS